MPTTRQPPIFERVYASFIANDTVRVGWEFLPSACSAFKEPASYQLQRAETGEADADWVNIGLPATNAAFLVDDQPVSCGGISQSHYRVRITDAIGSVFVSPSTTLLGKLNGRDLLLAREIIRKSRVSDSLSEATGWLFKRKWSGEIAEDNVDELTGEVLRPHDNVSKGTRFIGGFYAPVEFGMVLSAYGTNNDRNLNSGQTDLIMQVGEAVAFPLVRTNDVWVDRDTDSRYYVGKVVYTAMVRNLPVLAKYELRQAKRSDPAFLLEVPSVE